MAEANHDNEGRLGIFWFFGGKLIIDSVPLSQAEAYGDALTHPRAHVDYWAEQQKLGTLPVEVEYEEAPRGRVGYDKCEERFYLRADKCILERKGLVRQIMTALKLNPEKTSTTRDDHYRCTRCLERMSERENQ